MKFLDQEILERLPEMERNLLSTLAVSEKPVVWDKLAKAVGWNGNPPENLLSHGLIIELEDGMWLHEALEAPTKRSRSKAGRKTRISS